MKITDGVGRVLVFFLILLFAYLCTSFVEWSFNPANWTQEVRWLTMISGVVAGSLFAASPIDFDCSFGE